MVTVTFHGEETDKGWRVCARIRAHGPEETGELVVWGYGENFQEAWNLLVGKLRRIGSWLIPDPRLSIETYLDARNVG